MLVLVINMHGESLMPCKQSKARKLLRDKQAKIVKYNPFTIQLLYGSSGYKQDVNVGIDLGAKYIGVAIQSQNKVIGKGEIQLRDDVKSNLETRKTYRKGRRNRKTRYRKARFLNRTSTKKEGWLPPSIKSRIDNTFFWIDTFCRLLPNVKLNIEVGKFDVQKMINPNIRGMEYQQGETYGYYDVRYYVFSRDNYTCQVCKKSKDKILHTHHIIYKSKGGSDKPSNLITVCTECHSSENHKEGKILYEWMKNKKKTPQYKEAPFMNSLRRRIFSKYPEVNIVYGSWTTPKRKELGLDKEHYNDALVISRVEADFKDVAVLFKIKQFRKKKRSLHEAIPRKGRKEPNRQAKRNEKNTKYSNGFYLNDKVSVFNQIGWISGFCNGGVYIKDINDNYITIPDKSYKQVGYKNLEFINHNNNWQSSIVCVSSHD